MERRNIIFLDIDGCLNSINYLSTQPEILVDERNVKNLEKIYKAVKSEIIIISTWAQAFRKDASKYEKLEMQKVLDYLMTFGIKTDGYIDMDDYQYIHRPETVSIWVKEHLNEIGKFVVIDDNHRFEEYQKAGLGDHVVIPKDYYDEDRLCGLTEEDAKRAIEIMTMN